jgi:hypothetical protein
MRLWLAKGRSCAKIENASYSDDEQHEDDQQSNALRWEPSMVGWRWRWHE